MLSFKIEHTQYNDRVTYKIWLNKYGRLFEEKK